MEKDRGAKILAVVAICIAVVGMTIGFAAFSQTLNIIGTGEVKASKFSVIFEHLQGVEEVGTANEVTTPTINTNSTVISNYKVELSTPGDSISYTFDITNEGTYDAKISEIVMAGIGGRELTVEGTGDDSETDEANVKGKLSYTLTYVDGGAPVAANNVLAAGQTKTVKLTLTYESFDDESLLPKNDVTIGNLDVAITYVQA